MNPPAIDYSQRVVMLKDGAHTEMSLADSIQAVMQLNTLGDRLACTIMRRGTPMQYAEIVRISGRRDFPRLAMTETVKP